MESLTGLPLDESEVGAAGRVPESVEGASLGRNTDSTIRGGDIRIFRVRVKETGVEMIAHKSPPARPQGRILPLRDIRSGKREIMTRPTFFEHFDGVVLDWRYLHDREKTSLEQQARWLGRQRLRILVDASSGIHLYPTLRLVDNIARDYNDSMATLADVMAKMKILRARDLILSLHRYPENNFTGEQTKESFVKTRRRRRTCPGGCGTPTRRCIASVRRPKWPSGSPWSRTRLSSWTPSLPTRMRSTWRRSRCNT